jgi:cytochrome b subunit of formate dehydrogenase
MESHWTAVVIGVLLAIVGFALYWITSRMEVDE